MKVEITLKSGAQFVVGVSQKCLGELWKSFGSVLCNNIQVFDNDLSVVVTEIAAIRRVDESAETFEPVDNSPESIAERELEKEKERWQR